MTRVDPFLARIPEMSDEKVQQCLDFAQKIREATRQQSRARMRDLPKHLKAQEKALLKERDRRRGEVVEKESLTAAQVDYATLSFVSTDRSA
jgi:hypothetical protein